MSVVLIRSIDRWVVNGCRSQTCPGAKSGAGAPTTVTETIAQSCRQGRHGRLRWQVKRRCLCLGDAMQRFAEVSRGGADETCRCETEQARTQVAAKPVEEELEKMNP